MKHLLVIFGISLAQLLSGQLVDSFDDGSFPSEPLWLGNTDHFVVNADGELQLNASDAGTSTIFSAVDLPSDTISFGFEFRLDFNPSGSNQLRVYLALDDQDISTASGYYLELGETGANDAIRLYHLNSGVSTELAVGALGAVSEEPKVNVRVDAYPNGLWVVSTDYTGGTFLEEDIVVMDSQFDISGDSYFGFSCSYTASRSDLFYFDNVNVAPFEEDKEAPIVTEASVIGSNEIRFTFSEPVTAESASAVSNFRIADVAASAIEIVNPTVLITTFSSDFPANEPFSVIVDNLVDLFDNTMVEPQVFELNYARLPRPGDLIINEIMFAARVDGEDYVELKNTTEDFLDLSNCILGNNTKTTGATKVLAEETILKPEGYIAFTEKRTVVLDVYQPINAEQVVEQDIPDFNNDEGNVFIALPDGTVLDSYDYSEDAHFELLSEVKGISLERVSATLETNDPEAWTSASKDVNYGTPGYVNSAMLSMVEVDDMFEFVEKVFSPNGDNDKDVMVLAYELDKAGYVANIDVRDVGGFLIKRIKSNETLSTGGLITWNGLDAEGKVANIGMYILVGEFFHPDGDVLPLKKVCVLAGEF